MIIWLHSYTSQALRGGLSTLYVSVWLPSFQTGTTVKKHTAHSCAGYKCSAKCWHLAKVFTLPLHLIEGVMWQGITRKSESRTKEAKLPCVSNWPAARNTEESPQPLNKPQFKTVAFEFPHELKRLHWGYGCRYLVVMHLARTILTWSPSHLVRSHRS